MGDLRYVSREGIVDKVFQEKIMLAVTEINGCEMCHTFHTKEAQKLGIEWTSDVQIGRVDLSTKPEDIALNFARHYAQTDGEFLSEEWEKLIENYGEIGAKGILGAIRIITMGNVYGIASGALINRFKLKPVKGSHLLNEISVTLSIVVFMPLAFIKKLFKR
jgi:AhpD family alkylhydroperoxidase